MTIIERAVVTVAALGLLSTSALADCRIGDPTLDQHILERRQLQAGSETDLVRNLRKLRRGAYVLEKYDRDTECRSVVAAIQNILQRPGPDDQRQATDAAAPAGDRPELAARRGSKVITEMGGRIRADRLIGSDLVGVEDDALGEIEDLVLDTEGKPAYVLVSHGGFLGLGEKIIAVPFELLHVSPDRDVFFLPMTKDQLEAAPAFDRGRFDWLGDQRWRDDLERYFNEQMSSRKT